PAYNEEKRIEPTLREYAEYFRRNYNGKFQLVVVLNGCRDDTLGVVNRVARDFPEISALNFPEPIGKGGALIEGLKLAPNTDLIGYVDADGATGPKAFFELARLTALAARRGAPSEPAVAATVLQPRVPRHCPRAVLDEHCRHAVPGQGDAPRGG